MKGRKENNKSGKRINKTKQGMVFQKRLKENKKGTKQKGARKMNIPGVGKESKKKKRNKTVKGEGKRNKTVCGGRKKMYKTSGEG